MAVSQKFLPGSDAPAHEIFQYPFFLSKDSKEFIKTHGKIMFIVRGLPGTGKSSLNDLILAHFPSSIKCSADDFFNNTFTSRVRNRETLKKSHLFCYNRVKEECEKGSHPIIVSNTHVEKMEMQQYLNFAQDYGYTVIILNTLDKFEVSPEILSRSNTKGLNKLYFEKRMKKWHDMLPILMGWFLNCDDAFYVFYQLQFAIDALVGDGKFCRVFHAFDKDSFLSKFKAKEMLFCIAGFWKTKRVELKDYYNSTKVREASGKCFSLSIQAFLVAESDIFALVPLDDVLKSLLFEENFEYNPNKTLDTSDIADELSLMSFEETYKFKLTPLSDNFSAKPKTASLVDKSMDHLNVNKCSFIHLAEREEKLFSSWELIKLIKGSFKDTISDAGDVPADCFNELEGGYKSCRLQGDSWVIMPPQDLSVKTVFTGLYL